MANDFNKTRNDFQQYDLVTVFKSSETRIMRHLHVSTMAVVTKIDGDTIQCMPFPIRENTTANNIYAFNIGNVDYEVGDKVLVIFTDRDFRKNYASATTSERSIGTTNDALLHSIDYGVVLPIVKESKARAQRAQRAPIAVENHKHGISFTYAEIKATGSLYECLGADKNKAYNVYLILDSRPPIPLTFNEKANDFLTDDGDSCLDYPTMKGVLYETY